MEIQIHGDTDTLRLSWVLLLAKVEVNNYVYCEFYVVAAF
jgi:hypothetical protein